MWSVPVPSSSDTEGGARGGGGEGGGGIHGNDGTEGTSSPSGIVAGLKTRYTRRMSSQ